MNHSSFGPALSGSVRYIAHSAFLSTKGYAIKRLRAGREFKEVLAELEQSDWYPQAQLDRMRDEKLRAMIAHAYENVPYYRGLFDRHGIKVADIEGAPDLEKIPALSKDEIKANPDDFIARNYPQRLLATGRTTGTTGSPLDVRRTMKSIIFDKATLARQRRRAGIDIYDRNVAIWGTVWSNVIVPRDRDRPPYWKFNAADNQLLFSYYHLSDETLPLFVEKLKSFKPAYIEGFPSTMLTLARFMTKHGEVVPIKAIFTSSEPLYVGHRREIEAAFQGKVFNYYGHAERTVTAAECDHGTMHINPEYGILEILRDGQRAAPVQRGEIVGTGLTNFGMPLIRYRSGDMSRMAEGTCLCGRETPLLSSIVGRKADFIRTPDGRLMPGDGVMEAFYGLDNIKASQIVQEKTDQIVVKLVKDDCTAMVNTGQLMHNLEKCLGDDLQIAIEFVDKIPDSAGLKRRWVVSKIGGEVI